MLFLLFPFLRLLSGFTSRVWKKYKQNSTINQFFIITVPMYQKNVVKASKADKIQQK